MTEFYSNNLITVVFFLKKSANCRRFACQSITKSVSHLLHRQLLHGHNRVWKKYSSRKWESKVHLHQVPSGTQTRAFRDETFRATKRTAQLSAHLYLRARTIRAAVAEKIADCLVDWHAFFPHFSVKETNSPRMLRSLYIKWCTSMHAVFTSSFLLSLGGEI